jgi:hypothetical protein
MTAAAHDPGHAASIPHGGAWSPLSDLVPDRQQDLLCQLDAATDFADYCRFLAGDEVSVQAAELVSAAQALYERTSLLARRSNGPLRGPSAVPSPEPTAT